MTAPPNFTETDGSVPRSLAGTSFDSAILYVLGELRRGGHQAFIVGGCVRDILLGRRPDDFDIATDLLAQEVTALFRRQKSNPRDGWQRHVIATGEKHGTVTVRVRPKDGGAWSAFEVTTFRGEGAYRDGRHPESVVFLQRVEDDLARRDFTINAMAYDPIGGIFVDPFQGRADLAAGIVRCVGRPLDRFLEDGLRLIRAVRFAARLGFAIENDTLAAIQKEDSLNNFGRVSRERQRDEFVKLLNSPDPVRGVRLLEETGLMARLIPEFAALDGGARRTAVQCLARLAEVRPDASLELRLTALLGCLIPPCDLFQRTSARNRLTDVLRSLRFSNGVIDAANRLAARRSFGGTDFPDDASLRRALFFAGETSVPADLLTLALASGAAPEAVKAREARIEQVLSVSPPLTMGALALDGRRVGEILGTGPGPMVGGGLAFLMDRVLENPGDNTPQTLERLLRERFAAANGREEKRMDTSVPGETP